jgi:hypothetical protein
MKAGDMHTLPLCLGCGKTHTAALGAATLSSYYQATPCPSTKIDDLKYLEQKLLGTTGIREVDIE